MTVEMIAMTDINFADAGQEKRTNMQHARNKNTYGMMCLLYQGRPTNRQARRLLKKRNMRNR